MENIKNEILKNLNEDEDKLEFVDSLIKPIYKDLAKIKEKMLNHYKTTIKKRVDKMQQSSNLETKKWNTLIKKQNKYIKLLKSITNTMLTFRETFPEQRFNPPPGGPTNFENFIERD